MKTYFASFFSLSLLFISNLSFAQGPPDEGDCLVPNFCTFQKFNQMGNKYYLEVPQNNPFCFGDEEYLYFKALAPFPSCWIDLPDEDSEPPAEIDLPFFDAGTLKGASQNDCPECYDEADNISGLELCAGCPFSPTMEFRYSWDPGRVDCQKNSYFDAYFMTDDELDGISGPRPLLVLLHGGRGTRGACSLKRRAVAAARRGYVAIIPDYTTPRDSEWGGELGWCNDNLQNLFSQYYAVRDVRSAILRALRIASLSPDLSIDHSNIFVQGNSHGAITALHLAHFNATDFKDLAIDFLFGNQNIESLVDPIIVVNGTTYTFDDLNEIDSLEICPPGTPACTTWLSNLVNNGFEISENIKAIYCSGGGVTPFFDEFFSDLDPNRIVPTLFSHGTCDRLAPYDQITNLELQQIVNAGCGPEEDIEVFNYTGPLELHDHFKSKTGQAGYQVLLEFCEGGHGLSYGIEQEVQEAGTHSCSFEGDEPATPVLLTERLGILDYEMFRMFSIILNDEGDWVSEKIRFQQLENKKNLAQCHQVNTRLPSPPESLLCDETCTDDDFFPLFNPELSISFQQTDRYFTRAQMCSCVQPALLDLDPENPIALLLSEYCEPCNEETPALILEESEAEKTLDFIEVYDLTGNHLMKREGQSIAGFLKSPHGLSRGFYIMHLPSGKRKAVFIE